MVEDCERGDGFTLDEIVSFLGELEHKSAVDFIQSNGPKVCPQTAGHSRDLNFEVTQISDCVVVSAEISAAGLINLVNHCWGAVISLMTKGLMLRGYITRGKLIHRGNLLIGSGYQSAFAKEAGVSAFKERADEKGTPFVEIDSSVMDFAEKQADSCFRQMFDRYIKSDGQLAALYPFKAMEHSFMIGGFGQNSFDPEQEKNRNEDVRQSIRNLIARVHDRVDSSNPSAVSKAKHYVRALEKQLDVCDQTDKMIETLKRPFR